MPTINITIEAHSSAAADYVEAAVNRLVKAHALHGDIHVTTERA